MKRTISLLAASALAGTTAVVIAATGPAEAEPVVAAASDGKLFICHTGLGTKGRINGYFTRENLESDTGTSGITEGYSNARGCFSAADEVEERTRLTFGYTAKAPYRLKSIRVRQTKDATVTVLNRSDDVRVLLDEGEEVTVTFHWVRSKRR